MDIYLTTDASFDDVRLQGRRDLHRTSPRIFKIQLEKPSGLKPSSSDMREWDGAQEFCDKLEQASSSYQRKKGNNSYHLCIHVTEDRVAWQNGKHHRLAPPTVRVHGFLCDILQDLDNAGFSKLKLQIGFHGDVTNSTKLIFAGTNIPVSSKEALGPINDGMCIQNEKYFEATLNEHCDFYRFAFNAVKVGGSINVILSSEATLTCQSRLPEKLEIYRKILDNEIHSDVVIVTSDGVEVACNKNILAANSPVFAKMFETAMKETKTSRIEMSEMNEDVVRAFLAYLYSWDMSAPRENSIMALELLKAGHKYDIPLLQEDMKEVLVRKPTIWYAPEVALELFLVARNLYGWDNLKMKAVGVLKSKAAETTIESFRELVRGNAGIGMDVAFELFQLTSVKGENE